MVFEPIFVPRPNLEKVIFKCSFTIINRQPPPAVGFGEITDTSVWVTSIYEGVYFNNFIKFGIANDIRKRIIFHGMTGSIRISKGFDRPCFSVNSNKIRQIQN